MAEFSLLSNSFNNEPYMSPRQLLYFKEKLINWRNELSFNLKRSVYSEKPAPESNADWLDTASQQTQSELFRVNCEHSMRIIQEIDDALIRINKGTYGFCFATGEEIGVKRLIAMPIAKYSVEAQEERELRRKSFR